MDSSNIELDLFSQHHLLQIQCVWTHVSCHCRLLQICWTELQQLAILELFFPAGCWHTRARYELNTTQMGLPVPFWRLSRLQLEIGLLLCCRCLLPGSCIFMRDHNIPMSSPLTARWSCVALDFFVLLHMAGDSCLVNRMSL